MFLYNCKLWLLLDVALFATGVLLAFVNGRTNADFMCLLLLCFCKLTVFMF